MMSIESAYNIWAIESLKNRQIIKVERSVGIRVMEHGASCISLGVKKIRQETVVKLPNTKRIVR